MSRVRIIHDNFNHTHGVYFLKPKEEGYSKRFLAFTDRLISEICNPKVEFLAYVDWENDPKTGIAEAEGWDWIWYSPKLSKKTLKSMINGGGPIWRPAFYGQNLARMSELMPSLNDEEWKKRFI